MMIRARQRGFTLMELMITVAVVGILAAVAFPSYTQYIVRANRSAAQSFMFSVNNKQEQYMLDARSYAANLTALNMTVPVEVSERYDVTVASNMAATPPTYLVTAAPKGVQLSRDTKCRTLTLSNLGVKTESGTASSFADCW